MIPLSHRLASTLAASLLALALAHCTAAAARAQAAKPKAPAGARARAAAADTVLDLKDFGAVGDGAANDAPALQAALDALAAAGGGTLDVPAGKYALDTPVSIDFSGLDAAVTIRGVESQTPVNTKGGGQELTRGLNLTSEFVIRVGEDSTALALAGLESLLVHDLVFIGTPEALSDARVTLGLWGITEATVRHCEFYGLSTLYGGAIIHADNSNLKLDKSVFLGSTGNSGLRVPIVLNTKWKGVSVTQTIFADYGQRPELYGKLGLAAPYAWVIFANPAPLTNLSPRREVFVRDVFLDEGALLGLASIPGTYDAKSPSPDLIYVSDLRENVSNLHGGGVYVDRAKRVLVERSHFGWSSLDATAITLLGVGDALIDRVECVAQANRIQADGATGKLTVINSVYTHLDSQAQTTDAYTTETEDADTVQHVRAQYLSALGSEPDAAGHSYWSDRLLACGDAAACVAQRRQELSAYLAGAPQPNFAIRGRVLDEFGEPVVGVAVSLGGSLDSQALTDTSGDFVFAGLPTSGAYAVAPALPHYTFEAPSLSLVTPGEDQSMSFAATINRYHISGRVRNASGQGIAGVAVSLAGPSDGSATTGADGSYDFNVPALGNYEVSISRANYSFDRTVQTFASLDGDKTADFTGTLLGYKIAGRITEGTAGLSGVTVTLTGSQSSTATTNAGGNYSITVPAEGDYTVTPSKRHYTFSPKPVAITSLGGDRTADFAATLNRHSLAASVTDAAGANFAGVTLTLAGPQTATATTGASGAHTFTSLPAGGNYTITPSKKHYSFTPASKTFDDLGADAAAAFTGRLNTHTIAGRVTDAAGAGVAGARVELSGQRATSATTDAAGNYSFADLSAGGDYTLTVSRANYTFEQPSRTFKDLGAAQTADFKGSLVNYAIAGRLLIGGAPASGVLVTLSGAQSKQATTDAAGGYSFSVPAEGDYTVTPSKPHHTFAPASLSYAKLGGNQTANFDGAVNRHAITVRVGDFNNYGLGGVTLTLSGSESRSLTTNANGLATFTNLAGGGSYTVRATLLSHTFSPAERTFADLGLDGWVDMVAVFTTYTISGRVTEKGRGLAGVTITLSGSQSGAVMTDARGSYAFTVGASGDYAVAASKKGYTFDRVRHTFNSLGGNRTANFKMTSKSAPRAPKP